MKEIAKEVVTLIVAIHMLYGCGGLTRKPAHQNSAGEQTMNSLKNLLYALRHERNEKKAISILNKEPALATQVWNGEDDVLIKGSTPLHYAAHYDYMDLVKLLVEHGADIEADTAHWWKTPLAWAADAARAEAVKFLLDKGAKVNTNIGGGFTALHAAAQGGSTQGQENSEGYRKTAELLIKYGANIDAASTDGDTPLADAVRSGNKAIEGILRQHGAKEQTELTF